MFQKLLSYATSGITHVIAKYAMRASVAIPFVFAFGFGLAGVTVALIDAYGYRDAYFLLAGGFVALGAVAALAVWFKEQSEEQESATESHVGSATAVASTAIETAKHIPSAIGAGTSDASATFRDLARLAWRNWPLVLGGGIVLLVLGSSSTANRYGRGYRSRF